VLPATAAVFVGAVAAAASGPAEALVIDATYDPSISSASAGFTSAFRDAVDYFASTFSNPITVNIDVGWGKVGGGTIALGALGEGGTYLAGYYTYGVPSESESPRARAPFSCGADSGSRRGRCRSAPP
jgi:hypothetical protein